MVWCLCRDRSCCFHLGPRTGESSLQGLLYIHRYNYPPYHSKGTMSCMYIYLPNQASWSLTLCQLIPSEPFALKKGFLLQYKHSRLQYYIVGYSTVYSPGTCRCKSCKSLVYVLRVKKALQKGFVRLRGNTSRTRLSGSKDGKLLELIQIIAGQRAISSCGKYSWFVHHARGADKCSRNVGVLFHTHGCKANQTAESHPYALPSPSGKLQTTQILSNCLWSIHSLGAYQGILWPCQSFLQGKDFWLFAFQRDCTAFPDLHENNVKNAVFTNVWLL